MRINKFTMDTQTLIICIIIGVAAGMLFAPKAGDELREDLGGKVKDLKGKADTWVAEQLARL